MRATPDPAAVEDAEPDDHDNLVQRVLAQGSQARVLDVAYRAIVSVMNAMTQFAARLRAC